MKRYKKCIVCLCAICMIVTSVNAAEFIKIGGGLGLKDDGTIWKLPFAYDNMLLTLTRKNNFYHEGEPKSLTQIREFGEQRIIDFEADTYYKESLYLLWDILYTTEDGITHGYTGSIFGTLANVYRDELFLTFDNIVKLCPSNTEIAITNNGLIYKDNQKNVFENETPNIVTADFRNYAYFAKAFAVDSDGNVYQCSGLPLGTGIKKLSKLNNIEDIKATYTDTTLCLDRNGNAFICSIPSLHDDGPLQKWDVLDNVKSIHSYATGLDSKSKWGSLGEHYAVLREDGTVWHFGYMADKYRQESEEELKLGKNVMKEPVQIKGIDGVKQIDVLDENIFMLKEDGSIVLWGLEPQGGMHTDTPYPLVVRDFYLYMTTAKDTIEINGLESELDEGRGTRPEVNNGTVMVPVRNIVEKLGGSVTWEEELQRVTIDLWGKTIQIRVGDNQSVENDTNQTLSEPSIKLNDRTMVAVDFFEKVLGFTVETEEREGETTIKLVYNEIVQ